MLSSTPSYHQHVELHSSKKPSQALEACIHLLRVRGSQLDKQERKYLARAVCDHAKLTSLSVTRVTGASVS